VIRLSLKELKDIIKVEVLNPSCDEHTPSCGISIDSRTIQKENIFFALKGENFDGHDFVKDALDKEAAGVVIEKDKVEKLKHLAKGDAFFVAVENTRFALGQVARWYARKFDLKTVAITGTNGKTTTKDMVAGVLAEKYSVLKSPRSYNNLVGIPLTLFQLTPKTEALVVELGTTDLGQIGLLTELTSPDVGIITNIGPAHLESMKTIERIARAKFELVEGLKKDSIAILNIDDPIISEKMKKEKIKALTFGMKNKADYFARKISFSDKGWVSFSIDDLSIKLRLLGEHNVYNALAAFAAGERLGLEKSVIKRALENYHPSEFRMELVEIGGIRVINDSYNANPVSVKKALETLKGMRCQGRKIVLLGDMLELGEKSEHFHEEIGKLVPQADVDFLLTVGRLSEAVARSAKDSNMNSTRVLSFSEKEDASAYLKKNLLDGDLLLVKGSRRMELDKVVEALKNKKS